MSLSVINDYERRLQSTHQIVSEVEQRCAALQSQYQIELTKKNQYHKALTEKQAKVEHLVKDNQKKDEFIQTLKEKIQNQQKGFKQLYDSCYCLESLSSRQERLIIEGNRFEMEIQDIKLSAERNEIKALEKLVLEKRQSVRRVLKENRQLKESVLKLTHEHHMQILSLKEEITRLNSAVANSIQTLPPVQNQYCNVTSDWILNIKKLQIEELKQKYKKEYQNNKLLIARQKQLELQLQLARREYEHSDFQDFYIQNTRLVSQNKQLKEKLSIFNETQFEQLKKKTSYYLQQGKTLSSLEQTISDLQKQLTEEGGKDKQQYVTSEVSSLQREQKFLRLQLQKWLLVLKAFNQIFIQVCPQFKLYKYDILNAELLLKQAQVSEEEINEATNVAKRTSEVNLRSRELDRRQEKLKEQQNEFILNKSKHRQDTKELLYNEHVSTWTDNSPYYQRAEEIAEQKINELLYIIHDYKRKEAIWQGEKKYLFEQKQLQQQNKTYQFIPLNETKFIQLQSIILKNIEYQQINQDVIETVKKIEEKVNKENKTIKDIIEQNQLYLSKIHSNNLNINGLIKQLNELKQRQSREKKQNQEKDKRITQIQSMYQYLREEKEQRQNQNHPQQIISPIITFPTKSDVNSELVKQLSVVLSHNETITQRLLNELQTVKQQYLQLESTSSRSTQVNQALVEQNNQLKFKVAEAVIEIEDGIYRQKMTNQEVGFLRSENVRLNMEYNQKQQESHKNRELVEEELEKLRNSVQTSVSTSLVGIESESNPNSSSLISVIESLKQLVNQKNSEIVYWQDKMASSKEKENKEPEQINVDLSKLLEKAITVITELRQA